MPSEPPRATFGSLLSLSWPIILARATQSVLGFCDALFVAPLGEAPLAATTTGALNALSLIILPMGTVFIIQSFVAQLRGRGDVVSAPRFAWYGLGIAGVAGVLSAVAVPFVPGALSHFHYAPEVHRLMSAYLRIRLWSVTAAVGMEALGNWYGGLGDTRPSMVAGAVAMVVNVLGCVLLVEPRFGLPGYGVEGAAWASVLGSWLGFAVLGVRFLRDARVGRFSGLSEVAWPELGRVLRFGIPNGLNWYLEFAAFALFINLVVGHLGTTVLAAFNVVMQINAVSFMPAFGVASGGAIMVGEAIGRKATREVWPIVRLAGTVAAAWMGSVGVLYAVAPDLLIGLFRPRDVPADALMHTGAAMLVFAAIWQIFDAIILTLGEALRAAGDTVWCMSARIVLSWFVFTPCAWAAIFLFGGGVNTVMLSLIAYLATLAVAFSIRFASGRWKNIDLIGAGAFP
jgi:MATE family multidrug resistance protein